MEKLTKLYICLFISMLLANSITAQTGFEKYRQQMQEAFDSHRQKNQESFNAYRDSLNHSFATFLETAWKSFLLQAPEPLIKTPIRVPPVYDLAQEEPQPTEIPIKEPLKSRVIAYSITHRIVLSHE